MNDNEHITIQISGCPDQLVSDEIHRRLTERLTGTRNDQFTIIHAKEILHNVVRDLLTPSLVRVERDPVRPNTILIEFEE